MNVRPFAAALSAVLLAMHSAPALAQPPSAISAKEKMEICKFGAKDQNLKGKAEQDFIKRCMAKEDAPASQAKKK